MAENIEEYPTLDEETDYELIDCIDWEAIDEGLDDVLQESAKEVAETNMEKIKCPNCPKEYKTTGGFRRHFMDKHEPKKDPTFTSDRLKDLLQDSKAALQNNKNYPEDFRAPLQTFQPVITPAMLSDINSSCEAATDDPDNFYKKFYPSFVSQGQLFFQLGNQLSNLLMKKFGERIMEEITKKTSSQNPSDIPIKPVEKDVIQNLSGYVVKTFIRKFQKGPDSNENKQILSILYEMVDNDDKENQRLINALDRGRLTATKKEVYEMFVVAETIFRRVNFLKERKVSCEKLALDVTRDPSVQRYFLSILSGVTAEEELSSNLLHQILVHYLKVRTFSAARRITLKHRLEHKKKKSKGLRKSMKKNESMKQQ